MENVTSFVKESHLLKEKRAGGPLSIHDFGWGNGYAIIPKGYPGYKMDYDAIHAKWDIDVYGGLTFASSAHELEWDEIPEQFRHPDYWVVGFDTCHYGDSLQRWPKKRVEEEAARLAFQFYQLKLMEIRKKKRVTKKKK